MTLSAQAPVVVATSPARHSFMGPFDPIRITFAAPITPATVDPQSFSVFGRWTGVVPGSISVDAAGQVVTFQPSRPLFVGDYVWIDLADTITSAAGLPLTNGYHFQAFIRSSPGSGVFQQTQTIQFRTPGEGAIATYGIHAGDVDRDGSPDITAINEASHDLRVFKNGGCADFGPMTLVQDGQNWPSPHESADFNRDGWLDLVTGDYLFGNLSVFLNDGAGNYLPPLNLIGNSYIRSVGAADFNGDGFPDIAAGNGTRTLIWLNDGTGGFLAPTGYMFQGSAEMNIADVNEDGIWDIVGSDHSQNNCGVILGNGDGSFSPYAAVTPTGTTPFQSAVHDLNGDGHIDIAFCGLGPDVLTWLLGDGNGNFTPGGTMAADSWPTSVHLADLEGDGDVDAVLSHYTGASFYIYFNDGLGGFSAPTIFPAVAGAACTTIADFDRDGDLDIMGADEIVDIGMLFEQIGPATPGLQQADCDAALRIDQRADGAGWNGTAPVPVHSGAAMALSLSGPNHAALGILFLGSAASTGLTLPPWGLVAIDVLQPFVIIGASPLDQHGEFVLSQSFPPSAPIGSTLAVQGLVLAASGERLSNPMQFTLVP